MLTGQQKVMRNLDRKFNAISNNIDEALIEIGERGVNHLKNETPVDTGRLRQSMSYTVDKKVYRPLGTKDNVDPTNEKETVVIGTNVVYAPFVEYRAKNGSQGFMLRSYRKTKRDSKPIFEKAMKKGAKK